MEVSNQAIKLLRKRSRINHKQNEEAQQDATCNHYQPFCFDDFPLFDHQPRDRRSPSLIGGACSLTFC